MSRKILVVVCAALVFQACKKWEDKPAQQLDLQNKYCNNPDAINYNFGFPGIEDSTVCIFPSEPFEGTYTFADTLIVEGITDPIPAATYTLSVSAKDRKHFSISGFCSNGNLLSYTADRYYHGQTDTLVGAPGTQLFCRTQDTVSGSVTYRPSDSSLYVELRVVSDTGVSVHQARAYKK